MVTPRDPSLSPAESQKIETAILKLVEKGAVAACTPCRGECHSPFFLREKSNGDDRFIFKLKRLDQFIIPLHFKMKDIKGHWDLKNGYLHLPIIKEHRQFIRYSFKRKLNELTSLLFGLCTVPYIRQRGFWQSPCAYISLVSTLCIPNDLTTNVLQTQ